MSNGNDEDDDDVIDDDENEWEDQDFVDPPEDEDGNFIVPDSLKGKKEIHHKCGKCSKIWVIRNIEQINIWCTYCGYLNNSKDSRIIVTVEEWRQENSNYIKDDLTF